MKLDQRLGLYGGALFLSAGTAALSVVLTRLYSAILGHHLAFFAISLALFGVGAGGLVVALFPSIVRPPKLFGRLAVMAGLASFGAIIAGIYLVRFQPVENLDRETVERVLVLYAVASLPFVFSGLAIAAAVKHAGPRVARLYLADMAGAALGSAGAIPLLTLGAPRALLAASIVMGIASVFFSIGSREESGAFSKREERAHPGVALAFLLSTITVTLGDIGAPWFRIESLKYVQLNGVAFQAWNELALVTVDKPVRGMAWMRMDGSAATAILDEKTMSPRHPDEMAYVLSGKDGPSLIVGAGGGRDVRVALANGQTDVDAVELNRTIVHDVMLGQFKEFSGGLFAKPEVHVTVADGRSFIRASKKRYRNITISLVDTWSASSVGGLALSESSLYTTEAFRDFIEHLTDDGTFVVNRWDTEFDRLLSLGAAGLRASGVTDPRRHLFACSATRSTALLMKRTALTDDEIAKLDENCERSGFGLILTPGRPSTDAREAIVATADGAQAETTTMDLTAPTDDRPFFFYSVPLHGLRDVLGDSKRLATEQQGLLTLILVLGASVVFALIALLLPALARRDVIGGKDAGPRVRLALFFSAIGLGYVLVEVALVQHLAMFLGHPVYALSAVLTSLLLATGVGSYWTRNVHIEDASPYAAKRALILAVLLAGLTHGLGPLTSQLVGLPFVLRLGISLLVIAPLGLLMGAMAPLGVVSAGARSSGLIAWCWSLNGFFSVVATALGTLLAMNIGFSSLLLLGAFAYFVSSTLIPRAEPKEDEAAPAEAAATEAERSP